MNIINCARCNKIIQQSYSSLCPDCRAATYDHASHVRDFVLAHPGLLVEEVARDCQLSVKDMEEMLFSGRLGSAAAMILFKCQSCQTKMSAQHRKGRFCPDCANKIETQVIQLEREAAAQKEKEKAAQPQRKPDKKVPGPKGPSEVAASAGEPAAEAAHKPTPPEPKPEGAGAEMPVKQESASPASDSYGFKRLKDL